MASFLDSLTTAFTGQAAEDAAHAARATLLDTFGNLVVNSRTNRAQNLEDITSEYEAGRQAAAPFFGQAGYDLQQGFGQSGDLLNQIYTQPLQSTAGMSGNALGLNGPAGNAAATAAFQTSPGYQFQLEQGLEGINRTANAAGMGASGNMLREAQTYAQGLANQEYNNWLENVTQRESLYAPLASREADVYSEQGRQLGNLDVTQANFYNQAYTDEANRRAAQRLGFAGMDVNAAGIFGPALASTDLAVGAASQAAGANSVGLIGNTINAVGNIFRPGR